MYGEMKAKYSVRRREKKREMGKSRREEKKGEWDVV
jgi:hypothetical protein